MATDGSFARDVLSFVAQAVVVIVGWIVVDKLSSRRDFEKSRREMLTKSADELAAVVDKLLVDGRAYHLASRDETAEISLKLALQDLGLRTMALSDVCDDIAQLSACRTGIAALRRAITGRHFEDEHLSTLLLHDEQLELIASEASRARHCYVRLKHRQYALTDRK